ncbi:MAG: 8-oxo-dGTP diphosphatase [Planctomycetota bacterium]|jgi:8-oxo-dGTP diphosphatase
MTHTYDYPRPAVTVDVALFVVENSTPQLLLIKRKKPPFQGLWALPGGFVDQDEELEDAARRELLEETSIEARELTQLGAYGKPDRDPRGHTISVVFVGETNAQAAHKMLHAADDASEAKFFEVDQLPKFAFDHEQIVADAMRYFGQKK